MSFNLQIHTFSGYFNTYNNKSKVEIVGELKLRLIWLLKFIPEDGTCDNRTSCSVSLVPKPATEQDPELGHIFITHIPEIQIQFKIIINFLYFLKRLPHQNCFTVCLAHHNKVYFSSLHIFLYRLIGEKSPSSHNLLLFQFLASSSPSSCYLVVSGWTILFCHPVSSFPVNFNSNVLVDILGGEGNTYFYFYKCKTSDEHRAETPTLNTDPHHFKLFCPFPQIPNIMHYSVILSVLQESHILANTTLCVLSCSQTFF